MDPRLRSLVIVLVGAAVGAVVAGGAISYVNSSAPPTMPVSGVASPSESPIPSRNAPDQGEAVANAGVAPEFPAASANVSPDENAPSSRSTYRDHLFGSDGPSASVTTDEGAKPPAEKPAGKKAPPVVEEDASPKASDDDGGGLRDSGGKDGDGGSVR